MKRVRDVLNEYRWKQRLSLEQLEIWYVHRGAPGDTMIISGSDIKAIGKSFMELDGISLPYHRVLKIVASGKVIFERE